MGGARLISGVNLPMTSSVSLKLYLAAFLPFGPFGFEDGGISAADIYYLYDFPPLVLSCCLVWEQIEDRSL